MSTPPLQLIAHHDPLLIARRFLRIQDHFLVLGLAALAIAVHIGGPAAVRVNLGVQGTIVALLESAVIVPLGLTVYLWVADLIPRLFGAFRAVVVEDQSSYDEFLEDVDRKLDSPVWIVLATAVVIFYWIYRPLSEVPGDIQGFIPEEYKVWLRIVLVPVYSVPLYASVLSALQLLLALAFTTRFFSIFHLKLNPLHSDGAGGLGILGRMLTMSVLVATFVGAIALAMISQFREVGLDPFHFLEAWVLTGIYGALTPLLLMTWLWRPHRAMLAARNETLQPWANAFEQLLSQGELAPAAGVAAVKNGTDQLVELKRRYDLLRDTYPIWPLHAPALRGLVVTSALPLLTGIVIPLVRSVALK